MAASQSDPEAFRKSYFNQIAPIYAQVTGNATRDLFGTLLTEQDLGINDSSIIHDNAAGPGTATEALIPWCAAHNIAPKVLVTDYIPAMLSGFGKLPRTGNVKQWQNISSEVVDSTDLSKYADSYFSHSICNFSIATFGDPSVCVREIKRSLAPNGVAVFTAWKRFAAHNVVSYAQDYIKGEGWAIAHPVPIQGKEFMEEGYMKRVVAQGGFPESSLETTSSSKAVDEGEDWDGLFGFMTHPATVAMATGDWPENESKKWPEAVRAGMLEEKEKFGGVNFEAWNVIARL